MGFLDKFVNTEKVSQTKMIDPKKAFESLLRQASGSAFTREVKYNIYYQIIAFYGVVDGVGTSTLVANTALALAEAGLTVCVIDTSILAPVQDILLNTDISTLDESDTEVERLDWFDLPYTRKSPLHISKYTKNISVLSFKGKRHSVVDFLSTNDSESLVEIALSTLHNKFDLILIDCCHEMSSVNTACLQQAQQIYQVWNDSPNVIGNLENFISNSITLSCPLDKMRYVIFNGICKDAIGNMNELVNQYRCKHLATNYFSEEIHLQVVTGKKLFRRESTNEFVIDYTDCIIRIVCHILNISLNKDEPEGTITSNDIMDGKVEGTLHKELKDFNDKLSESVTIDSNPMNNSDFTVEESIPTESDFELDEDVNLDDDSAPIDSIMKEDIPVDSQHTIPSEQDAINYGGVMEEDDVQPEELIDSDGNGVSDILENPETKKKKGFFHGKKKKK